MADQQHTDKNGNQPTDDRKEQPNVCQENLKGYWQANLRLLAQLLCVWFAVSFGCGILLADWLDQFSFFGFRLGFWFAQQGAIYTFVVLIFVYSWRMKIIEREFGVNDDEVIK
tara:strand:- start:4878 stop:5216 length:339 start_codon:yes stop_codon:yes gene_type:complete